MWKTHLYPLYIFFRLPPRAMYKPAGWRNHKKAAGTTGTDHREHMGGYAMLKGVNKHVVEVVDIESEYFEKAILFLRPGRPDSDEGTLRQRAGEYLRRIKYRPRRGFCWQKALIIGLAAAGLLLAVGLVVWLSLPLFA